MQPIPNVDLNELFKEANERLIKEAKENGILQVKAIFSAIRVMSSEIKRIENELEQKKSNLAKKEAQLEKLKSGDWSVLKDVDEAKKSETVETQ